jgi:CheY-like chemotaxis protein
MRELSSVRVARTYSLNVLVAGVSRSRSFRFLIVDEYKCSRVATRLALEDRRHRCLDVSSEADALVAIDTFAPEIVLLEWWFRDGTGLGLARRLRQRAAIRGRGLILIATSSQSEPPAFRQAEQLDAYLVKPASTFDIESSLASIVRRSSV